MKVLLLAALLTVALPASTAQSQYELYEWELFKIEHMKEYATEEEELNRRETFISNLNSVREHNIKFERGEVSHKTGINVFADMTHEEFKSTMLGCRKTTNRSKIGNMHESEYNDVPKSLDWRKKGAVTEVKIQGHCGSCWAFAAVGSLEGMHFLKTKKLVSLSAQNLVDCDNLDDGCHSGVEETAYTFISKNGGIDTEASYPYKGEKESCKFKPQSVGATVKGYKRIPEGDEEQIKQVVATKGPVTVAIDGNQIQPYNGGVFEKCSKEINLNHAVVVVGYGTTDDGKDYWLIKNSWGPSWGKGGYMMLARGKNMCGVAQDAVYPEV